MSVIAINVLMDPDPKTVERARAANTRLKSDFPPGFSFDAHHAPHVTIVQCFVRLADMSEISDVVTKALHACEPVNWESRAVGFYALNHEDLALAGIVIEPTADLRRVQASVVEALAPFVVAHGTGDAFAPRADGAAIGQPTIDYVASFIGPRTGGNYNPHLTVGIGTRGFVDAMKTEPFEAFPVRAVSVSLYQLGDYGVAQKKLHELHRC